MTKFEEIGQKYQMQAYDIDYGTNKVLSVQGKDVSNLDIFI